MEQNAKPKRKMIQIDGILFKFRNTKILAIIGLICTIIGIFLPYLKFSVSTVRRSISMWRYFEGKIMLLLMIYNAILIFKDYIEKLVPKLANNEVWKTITKFGSPIFSLIPTGLYALLVLYSLSTYSVDVTSTTVKYSLGCYIIWFGIISLIGYSLLYKSKNQTSKGEINLGLGTNITNESSTSTVVTTAVNENATLKSEGTASPQNDSYIGNGIVLGFASPEQKVQTDTVEENTIANNEIVETFENTTMPAQEIVQNNNDMTPNEPIPENSFQASIGLISTEPNNEVPVAPVNQDYREPQNFNNVNTSMIQNGIDSQNIEKPSGPVMTIEPGKDMSRPDMIQLVPNGYGANKHGETANPYGVSIDKPAVDTQNSSTPVQNEQAVKQEQPEPQYGNKYNIPFYIPETENKVEEHISDNSNEVVKEPQDNFFNTYNNSNQGVTAVNNIENNNQVLDSRFFSQGNTPAYTVQANQNQMIQNQIPSQNADNVNMSYNGNFNNNGVSQFGGFVQNTVDNQNSVEPSNNFYNTYNNTIATPNPQNPMFNGQDISNISMQNNMMNNNDNFNYQTMVGNFNNMNNFGGGIQANNQNMQGNIPLYNNNVPYPNNGTGQQITKSCPNCGAIYDTVLSRCPNCGRENI